MVFTCSIVFDHNPSGIFFADQVITGRVTVTSDKVVQVKGVHLKIVGIAKTNWSESSGNQTYHYSGKERYLDSSTYLLGSEGGSHVNIEKGSSSFSFSALIPTECPSSFEGRHGHIRYMVKVSIQRSMRFDNHYTKGFTVLTSGVLDTLLRLSTRAEISRIFGLLLFRSDPLTMSVALPKCSYVPGEVLPVQLLVNNGSSVDVKEFKVALVMLVKYFNQSRRHSTKKRTMVTKTHGEGVQRKSQQQFRFELQVPATPPTCLHLCRVIEIRYELEITARVRAPHTNEVLHMPVVISTVPILGDAIQSDYKTKSASQLSALEESFSLEKGMERLSVMADDDEEEEEDEARGGLDWWRPPVQVQALPMTEDEASAMSEAVAPLLDDSPPPSYEEAMHTQRANLAAEEEDGEGESDFAPRYPVFYGRGFDSPSDAHHNNCPQFFPSDENEENNIKIEEKPTSSKLL